MQAAAASEAPGFVRIEREMCENKSERCNRDVAAELMASSKRQSQPRATKLTRTLRVRPQLKLIVRIPFGLEDGANPE